MSAPLIRVTIRREGGESVELGHGARGDRLVLIEGAQGLGMAPASYETAPVPVGHGSILRGSRLDERELFVPFLVDPGSAAEYDAELERLTRLVSPLDTRPLWLRVQPLGRDEWREIQVRYAGGLDGTGELYRGDYGTIGLRLRALDALWSGPEETITQTVTAGSKPFVSATVNFFPVMLADASVDGVLSLYVAGDAPTYPVWTVTPPGEDLTINHSSGAGLFLSGALAETITLDMRTRELTSASMPNGELWDRVSPTSRTFALTPGTNTVEFSMVNATAASLVHVTYRPQFLRGH